MNQTPFEDGTHAQVDSPRPAGGELRLNGTHAGRYQLHEEIARGGMGAIYRAFDPGMYRSLAVKVLLPEHQGNADLERRFLEEAQLAAQLQHPGIAPVHEIGQLADRRPFFAMKLIKGRTLADLHKERTSPATDLLLQAAGAELADAHARLDASGADKANGKTKSPHHAERGG